MRHIHQLVVRVEIEVARRLLVPGRVTGRTTPLQDGLDIRVGCLTFRSGGNLLALGEWETHQVRLLDTGSRKFIAAYPTGARTVFGAVFSQDEKILATPVGSQIFFFDVATGQKRAALRGHHAEVHALAHSPVAPLLASASLDGSVRLWRDLPSRQINLGEVPAGLGFLSLSSARPQLYSWATNGLLQFWGISKGHLTPTVAFSSEAMLSQHFAGRMQVSPDGSYAACGTNNGQVHVFECATGKMISSLPAGEGNVRAAAFSPDNQWLLTAEEGDANLRATEGDAHGILWDWKSKQIAALLPDVFCAQLDLPVGTFSPDGRLLAYVAQGYTVNLWDSVTKQVVRTLRGHGWMICALKFSPDGGLLATSSYDQTTCVWDVTTDRASPLRLDGQSAVLWFTRDSRTLITAHVASFVRYWNLATGQETLAIRKATNALLAPDDSALLLWRSEGVSLMPVPTLARIDSMEAREALGLSNKDQP